MNKKARNFPIIKVSKREKLILEIHKTSLCNAELKFTAEIGTLWHLEVSAGNSFLNYKQQIFPVPHLFVTKVQKGILRINN